MAGVYRNMVSEEVSPDKCRETRRLRVEMRRFGSFSGTSSDSPNRKELRLNDTDRKRKRTIEMNDPSAAPYSSSSSAASYSGGELEPVATSMPSTSHRIPASDVSPVFGSISVSGRSREMEDALSLRPDLCRPPISGRVPLHFFAVFDGHGGSHVATLCKERMHVFLQEELMRASDESDGTASASASGSTEGDIENCLQERWRTRIDKSFERMDVVALETCVCGCIGSSCGCDSAGLSSEIVGSTAVVALLTSDRIVVANCGDSRAVLSRGGKAIPLSFDHKPDRPDELARIEAAGGRVIYLNGARVLGILAMSRALGDKYLKPVVISKPEITFTNRTSEDECLILASDGLWDVLSNDVACDVARRCLLEGNPSMNASVFDTPSTQTIEQNSDEQQCQLQSRCSIAAALLTRLALGRRSADNISVIVIDLKRC